MNKRSVVYCDDQQLFLDQFRNRHDQYYEIDDVNDTRELAELLKPPADLPDLVLLDLYHPRDNEPDFEERRKAAVDSLTKLDEQIEETNQAVLAAWEPRGLELLKLLRVDYGYPPEKLPIVIYTQKGLLLLDDSQLREVELHSAHWLLKDRLSAHTEEIRIDRIINSDLERTRRAVRNASKGYRWSLIVSCIIIAILVSRMIFSTDQFMENIVAETIGGLITLVVSYPVILRLERRASDGHGMSPPQR